MKYIRAESSVLNLTERIVHEPHMRLDGAKIAVVMKEKASKVRGRTILAYATRPPASLRPLLKTAYDFVIVIGQDTWNDLKEEQRTALIDHELCHCEFCDGEPCMRSHDYEEFAEIIARHGFWRSDIAEKHVQLALETQGVQVGTI